MEKSNSTHGKTTVCLYPCTEIQVGVNLDPCHPFRGKREPYSFLRHPIDHFLYEEELSNLFRWVSCCNLFVSMPTLLNTGDHNGRLELVYLYQAHGSGLPQVPKRLVRKKISRRTPVLVLRLRLVPHGLQRVDTVEHRHYKCQLLEILGDNGRLYWSIFATAVWSDFYMHGVRHHHSVHFCATRIARRGRDQVFFAPDLQRVLLFLYNQPGQPF